MGQVIRITPTVAAFIRREGRILLLRRSGEVRSFAGLWNGVSGTVATDPVDQARVEIAEETGLSDRDLVLRAQGIPFTVADQRPGRSWRVFPLLLDWKSDVSAAIELNWENNAWRWVESAAVAGVDGVPRLADALARVVDPARMEEVLIADREHGSGFLAERLLDLMAALPAVAGATAVASRVAAAFPAMAPLEYLAAAVESATDPLRDWAERLRAEHEAGLRAVVAAAATALADADTIATLSHSSTVLAIARELPGRRWLVGESLPGGEGRLAAAALSALRDSDGEPVAESVDMLADAELLTAVAAKGGGAKGVAAGSGVAAVLLGADAVSAAGDALNKIGSAALAAAAREAGIPVIVAADPWKRLPAGRDVAAAGIFEVVSAEFINQKY